MNATAISVLAEEVPVAIEINGISFAVMMLSPENLDDFAVGFLFGEGLIEQVYDIHQTDVVHEIEGIRLCIELAQRNFFQFKERMRSLMGSSSCGICGKTSLQALFPKLSVLSSPSVFNTEHLVNIREQITEYQTLSKLSGAMHAAFWLDENAEIRLCREDIGRHNALDKLIGAAKKSKLLKPDGALLITSRCGAELVQKAIAAKVNPLISLASTSTFAVEMPNKYQLSLIHLRRVNKSIPFTEHRRHEDAIHSKID